MNSELAGKVAIVTGGASGIGRAGVAALLGAGAAVAVLDRDEAGVNAVVNEGKKSGGNVFALVTDLADTKRIPEAVARVLEQCGRIDILVNCAGVAGKFQTLLEIDGDNWDFVHTVNLKAPMLLMQHVARHMIDRGGGGRIVNISSSSAFRARNSPMAYATSKAAIVQLTRCAAAELGRYDINVNAIAPGITATAMTRALGNAEHSIALPRADRWRISFIGSRNRKTSPQRFYFSAFREAGKLPGKRSIRAQVRSSSRCQETSHER
jgi:NAD(P)-dependent dehydrogenase (short-subunit alcohol dehydrogenase family)